MARNPGDDEIGYGRPPKNHQFRPGRSGNPKGRRSKPAGDGADASRQSVTADVIEELQETITVRENGRERKISKQRAFVKALIATAIKGDVRAINAIVAFTRNFGVGAIELPSDEAADLEDLNILESFVERELQRRERPGATAEATASETQPQTGKSKK